MITSPIILSPFRRVVEGISMPAEYDDGNTFMRFLWSDPAYRTVVGGIVQEWIDVRGSGRKLTNTTPANGGKLEADCIRFIAAETRALRLRVTMAAPTMLYLVVRPDAWSTNRILDGGLSSVPFAGWASTPNYYFGPSGAQITGFSISIGDWHIIRARIDGANSYVQVDNGAKVTGDMLTTSLGGITLAARYNLAQNWSDVSYKDVMVRQISESDATAQKFYDYLKAYHGI